MATLEGTGPYTDVRGNRSAVRGVGGAANVQLLAGLDGVIQSNAAATREVSNAAAQMRINSERVARMTSSIDQVVSQQSQMLATINSAVGIITRAIGGGAPGGGIPSGMPAIAPALPSGLPEGMPAGVGRPPSAPVLPTGEGMPLGVHGPVNTGGVPEGHDEQQQQENWDRLQHGRGYSIQSLRQDTTRAIGRAVSGSHIGPNLRETSEGSGVFERFNPHTGESMGDASPADMRNMRIANRVRTVGGNVSEQGVARGLINSLPKGLGPALGYAGAAYAVVNQGLDIAEDQRAKNAQWQAVNGGSNASGFGERLKQYGFRLSQRGVMGGDQANELYQGVYNTGLRGEERQDALDLATENWRKFGMSVADSIKLIEVSAKHGQANLVGVADALDEVTTSAREAGVSAKAAREVYTANYSASVGTLTGNGTSSALSGALTAATTSLGDQMLGTVDTTGITSQQSIRMLAAQSGMGTAGYLASNPGVQGAANILGGVQQNLTGIATQILPGIRAFITRWKADHGVTGTLSKEQADELSTEYLTEGPGRGIDAYSLISAVNSRTQISITDPNAAVSFLVLAIDKAWNPAGAAQKQADALNKSTATTDSTKGRTALASKVGIAPWNAQKKDDPFGLNKSSASNPLFSGEASDPFGANAKQDYFDQSLESGSFSPLVAEALKGGNGQTFRIDVGNGQFRDMSMSDAVKYASDQLARGDVRITSGKNKGQTLAGSIGADVDTSKSIKDLSGNADAQKAGKADSSSEAKAAAAAQQSQVQGNLTITATPQLQSMFNFQFTSSTPSAVAPASTYPTGG